MRFFTPFFILLLVGCSDPKIYTEITDSTLIGHPPPSIALDDPTGKLISGVRENNQSATRVRVYIHCASCTNPQSRSLGSDFDGYVRVSIEQNASTKARAQMDYRGEPTPQMVQMLYTTLLETLHWKIPNKAGN
jgi:predicted DNA-binding transcriptional regulator AlpA